MSFFGVNLFCFAVLNFNLFLKISGDSLGIFGERFLLEDKFVFVFNLCLRFIGDFLVVGEWIILK